MINVYDGLNYHYKLQESENFHIRPNTDDITIVLARYECILLKSPKGASI